MDPNEMDDIDIDTSDNALFDQDEYIFGEDELEEDTFQKDETTNGKVTVMHSNTLFAKAINLIANILVNTASLAGNIVRSFLFGNPDAFNLQKHMEKENEADRVKSEQDSESRTEKEVNGKEAEDKNVSKEIIKNRERIKECMTTVHEQTLEDGTRYDLAAELGIHASVEYNKNNEAILYFYGTKKENNTVENIKSSGIYINSSNLKGLESKITRDIMQTSNFKKSMKQYLQYDKVEEENDLGETDASERTTSKKYVAYSTQRYTYAAVQASLLKSAYMLNLNQHLNPDENSGPTFTKSGISQLPIGEKMLMVNINRHFNTPDNTSKTDIVFMYGDKEVGRLDANAVTIDGYSKDDTLLKNISSITQNIYANMSADDFEISAKKTYGMEKRVGTKSADKAVRTVTKYEHPEDKTQKDERGNKNPEHDTMNQENNPDKNDQTGTEEVSDPETKEHTEENTKESEIEDNENSIDEQITREEFGSSLSEIVQDNNTMNDIYDDMHSDMHNMDEYVDVIPADAEVISEEADHEINEESETVFEEDEVCM